MNKVLEDIKVLQLNMGWQCNARYLMCYQRAYDPTGNMPANIYKRYLLPLYPHLNQIIIMGGEPTIMPNCRELVQFVSQFLNIRFVFITNGIHVDKFWEEAFREKTNRIRFPINAATCNTYDRIMKYGNFNKVLDNVRKTIKGKTNKKPFVAISALLLRHNASEIAQFIQLGHELGVDKVKFSINPVLSFYKLRAKDIW